MRRGYVVRMTVYGDIWIWSTGRSLNLNSTNYTMVTIEILPSQEKIPMVEPGFKSVDLITTRPRGWSYKLKYHPAF
jgi:hypothetical protein